MEHVASARNLHSPANTAQQYQMLQRLKSAKRKHDAYIVKQRHAPRGLAFLSRNSVSGAESARTMNSVPNSNRGSQKKLGGMKSDIEIRKYEVMLQDAADLADTEATGKFSCEGLGRLMANLGLYRVTFNSTTEEKDTDSERKFKELMFHHNFWRVFADSKEERVEWKFIQSVLTLLYSSELGQRAELIPSLDRIIIILLSDIVGVLAKYGRLPPAAPAAVPEWNVDAEEEKEATRWLSGEIISAFLDLKGCEEKRESRIQFLFQPAISQKQDCSPPARNTIQPRGRNGESAMLMNTFDCNMAATCAPDTVREVTELSSSRNMMLAGSNSTGNLRNVAVGRHRSPVEQGVLDRISMIYEKQRISQDRLKMRGQEVRCLEAKECTFRPKLADSRRSHSGSRKNLQMLSVRVCFIAG